MSYLLQIEQTQSKAVQRGAAPLMLEFSVSPETAPYLVSSSSSVLWVATPHRNDTVKAAVRKVDPKTLFQEIVAAVVVRGRQDSWGNIHPLTHDGLRHAISHVESYGLTDLELLVSEAPQQESAGAALVPPHITSLVERVALPVRGAAWLPEKCVIVIPRDRAYVGIAHQVSPTQLAAVVHNAARGIGIAQGGQL